MPDVTQILGSLGIGAGAYWVAQQLFKRRVRTEGEVEDIVASYEKQLAQLRADADARLTEMRTDRDFYRQLALRNIDNAKTAASVGTAALDAAKGTA